MKMVFRSQPPPKCRSFQAVVNRAEANTGLLSETWSHPDTRDYPSLTLSIPNLDLFFAATAYKKSEKKNP